MTRGGRTGSTDRSRRTVSVLLLLRRTHRLRHVATFTTQTSHHLVMLLLVYL